MQTLHLRVSEAALCYNSPDCPVCHRTLRCTSGATTPAQRSTATDTRKSATVHGHFAQSQSSRQKAHWTVNNTCPVQHRTVRCHMKIKLQHRNRQNPNDWVTWLAHRTLSGGAPDSSTTASPTVELVVGSYKYPPTTSTPTIQAFTTTHSIQEQYTTLQDTNQSLRSNQSPPFNSSNLGLVRRSSCVPLLLLLLGWLSSFSHSYSQSLVSKARDTNCVVVLARSK
jgi:hypothetical protein